VAKGSEAVPEALSEPVVEATLVHSAAACAESALGHPRIAAIAAIVSPMSAHWKRSTCRGSIGPSAPPLARRSFGPFTPTSIEWP
jgi:hypothetical protein